MSVTVSAEGVAELDGFTIIKGKGTPPVDFWYAIAGRVIQVEASLLRPGYQKKWVPVTVTPKADEPDTTQDESGTLSEESGSVDDGTAPEFYYCYDCKDAWDLDDDGFLDLTCPYCGSTFITIVEMKDDDVRDLQDDFSFFYQ